MSLKDRFPFNKLKKNQEPVTCVYAGPEEMRRRAGRDPGGMEEVYAGPEDMEGRVFPEGEEIDLPEPEEQPEPPMDKVYAGPPAPKAMEGVYAGPRPPEPMKPVYAGPEYPGPSGVQGPPPQPPMMCVYAGPDYFSGKAPIGAPAQVQDPNVRYCPNCGFPDRENHKFCTECGEPFPKKETT